MQDETQKQPDLTTADNTPSMQTEMPDILVQPEQINKPGIIVLQWLTYAFWGWAILALAILVSATFTTFVIGYDTSTLTSYALAAILVLLPIALVCDFFYSKAEPEKKTGAAMVVMVIHAVLFALLAIATLIAAVFSVVNLIITSNDTRPYQVALYSSGLITIVYIATFVRTINLPAFFNITSKFYKIFMLVFTIVVIIASVIGPIGYAQQTKNDKLIEENLYTIKSEISDYTRKNKALPESLDQLSLDDNAKILVEKNLVVYKPKETRNRTSTRTTSKVYNYELCVTYKKASPDYQAEDDKKPADSDTLESDSDSSIDYDFGYNNLYDPHPAGDKCYKLQTYGS